MEKRILVALFVLSFAYVLGYYSVSDFYSVADTSIEENNFVADNTVSLSYNPSEEGQNIVNNDSNGDSDKNNEDTTTTAQFATTTTYSSSSGGGSSGSSEGYSDQWVTTSTTTITSTTTTIDNGDDDCDDGDYGDDCEKEDDDICDPRTVGYWQQPCLGHFNHETQSSMESYLVIIHNLTDFFDNVDDFNEMCDILDPDDPMTIEKQARRQIMGLWLNVASGKIFLGTQIDLGSLSNSTTVGQALEEAESLFGSDTETAK